MKGGGIKEEVKSCKDRFKQSRKDFGPLCMKLESPIGDLREMCTPKREIRPCGVVMWEG